MRINEPIGTHVVTTLSPEESEAAAEVESQQNKEHDNLFVRMNQVLEVGAAET